ncbi:unnamed protein product [Peronospora destructor]|uniref:Uncharacterized protein n=1 Tax=Peronospora destructor TaxID=86335 RepID=A0AAV0TPD9_9STRA|nr:unnamed protein product [Peronospora destructor]
MACRASAKQVQQQLTKKWSTLHYRMEYGGYLSNHLLHGVVALFDLGASEEKIEHFAENYSTKLEKNESNYDDVTQFDALAKVLQESKLTFANARELLVGGLAGALLHSIIQLGYSYHIGGERLVAEGLTYMHYAYLSFDEPQNVAGEELSETKTFSRTEALQLVQLLNGNELLLGEMRRKLQTKPLVDLKIGILLKRLIAMSGDPERGSPTVFLLIWETINSYDLTKMDGVLALDLALWLYMMIEHNDFVILHAVTSAWALQQVEHLMELEGSPARMEESKPWEQIVSETLSLAEQERDLVHAYKLVQVARNHAKCVENAFLTTEERDFITRQSALKVITCDFGPLK